MICLQQLDGNVIGPKILGNTIGISGFWVLVSITVAAGLFGFAGMLLGVPVFAIIYMLISDSVNLLLKREGRYDCDRCVLRHRARIRSGAGERRPGRGSACRRGGSG